MNNTESKRKPYVREMKKDWWLKNAFYTGYMIREGTSIFVSIYAVVLMWGLLRLVQGQEAFNEVAADKTGCSGNQNLFVFPELAHGMLRR